MDTRQFVRHHKISLTADLVESNPNMSDPKWEATHWRVTLRRDRPHRQLSTYYSMGLAHTGEPTAEDVLDCLASDASSADQPFEEWASDYGYDPDSRKAERIYQVVVKQRAALERFLGPELFAELLEAERL